MLEKQIAGMLKSGLTRWVEKEIKPIDINGNHESDVQEIIDDAGIVIDSCERAFKAADYPRLMAGFAGITEGIRTVLASVDVPELKDALADCQPALVELVQLALGIFCKFVPNHKLAAVEAPVVMVAIKVKAEKLAEPTEDEEDEATA